ncbi:MAG: hypothetical protein C0507_20500 [Cyanobacteria bacterium PR.3.49]|nr:hypothetical protein [Cyanobacteria bacterium PR.3.49]
MMGRTEFICEKASSVEALEFHWRHPMNSFHVLNVQSLFKSEMFATKTETNEDALARKVSLDRFLIMASVSIIALLLLSVLHPNHFCLTACFGWAGMFVSDRLSRRSSMLVAPVLIFFNLLVWPESYIALPLAALTIGLASEFNVDDCIRDAMRLSGLTCAALTLLCTLA